MGEFPDFPLLAMVQMAAIFIKDYAWVKMVLFFAPVMPKATPSLKPTIPEKPFNARSPRTLRPWRLYLPHYRDSVAKLGKNPCHSRAIRSTRSKFALHPNPIPVPRHPLATPIPRPQPRAPRFRTCRPHRCATANPRRSIHRYFLHRPF